MRNEWRRQRIYLAVDEGENYDYLVLQMKYEGKIRSF